MGIAKDLVQSIQYMIDNAINKAPFDKTRKATITNVSSQNNTYTILLDGNRYSNIPTLNNDVFNINDVVNVLIPENQNSNMVIINNKDIEQEIYWDDINDKPTEFPPSSHTHVKSDITDFAHNHDNLYYGKNDIDTKLTGVEKRDLVWVNADPSSNFGEHTIPLDLSTYSAVEIEFLYTNAGSYSETLRVPIGKNGHFRNSYGAKINYRTMNVTTTGVSFSANQMYNTYADVSSTQSNNSGNIPYKIYGIKGV